MDFSYTLENINIAAQQFLHAIQNKKVIAFNLWQFAKNNFANNQ